MGITQEEFDKAFDKEFNKLVNFQMGQYMKIEPRANPVMLRKIVEKNLINRIIKELD